MPRRWTIPVAIAAGVLSVLLLTLPATAHIESIDPDTDNVGVITGDDVTLAGTITCSDDEIGLKIQAQIFPVIQKTPAYRGEGGRFRGDNCTGEPQEFMMTTQKSTGTPHPGSAQACVRVRLFSPGSLEDEERVCEGITLVASA
jgi:hypothetical protein